MALRTRYGHFEYWVMPFNLTNILATFHCYLNKILVEKLNIFVIIYPMTFSSSLRVKEKNTWQPFNRYWINYENTYCMLILRSVHSTRTS